MSDKVEIPDAAVEKAARTYYENLGWDWENLDTEAREHDENLAILLREFRAVLEAAVPLLGDRPLLDQQAVADVVYPVLRAHAGPAIASLVGTDILFALLKLARPMPTREQIEQKVRRIYIGGGAHITHAQEAATEVATVVLALLNGDES